MLPDLIIYINLDHRTDRRAEMEAELKRVGFSQDKILRWSATAREGRGPLGGALGCTLSHIAVLEYIESLNPNIETILILEDDFTFIEDIVRIKERLSQFLQRPRNEWDLVLLSYNVLSSEKREGIVSLALRSHGTAGYLLNRSAVANLLAIFKQSRDGVLATGDEQYVLDVYWQHFLANRRCFYFNEPLGFQRESFSDIQGKVMLNPSRAI